MCTSPMLRVWTSDISSFKIKHPGDYSLKDMSNQDAFIPVEDDFVNDDHVVFSVFLVRLILYIVLFL